VSISLSEELARPLTRDGVELDSVSEICGIEGVSVVELLEITDDVFVPREGPFSCAFSCGC
jgi:hypothetical protein